MAVQRVTIEVVDLADEPLLLLNRDFGTRQLFDAACRITHIWPRGVMESNEVHSLIALAEAGHGIAVVPSTVRLVSRKIRIMPIVQDGKSLGTWSAVVWDLRRSLAGLRGSLHRGAGGIHSPHLSGQAVQRGGTAVTKATGP